MNISNRLCAIVNEIGFKTLADIGTDHGYIPIQAIKTEKSLKAIACDVNSGPLKRAEENIEKYNLQDKIDLRLGGGFNKVKEGEVETATIGGMGGALIIKILTEGEKVVSGLSQLILQPQSEIPKVRKKVHSIGFYIVNEEMIYEDNKFYNILNCYNSKGNCNEDNYNEIEYLLGKILINRKDIILKHFLESETDKYNNVISKIKSSGENVRRIEQLIKIIKTYEEVIKCL